LTLRGWQDFICPVSRLRPGEIAHTSAAEQADDTVALRKDHPGVNPPAGMESEEIILATCGLSAGGFRGSAAAAVAVRI
jgi:hypothetical protein